MKFSKERLRSLAILTAVVVVLQWALSSFVYPLLKTTTQSLYSVTPTTALTGTLGDKVIGLVAGILPSWNNFATWGALFLGTFAVLVAGYFVYEQKWAWKGKNVYQRLWAILLYGSAVFYVFLLVTKFSDVASLAVPLVIGLAINYVIIAFVTAQLAKRIKLIRI